MTHFNKLFYEKALGFVGQQCLPLTTKALQVFQNQLSAAYREHRSTSVLTATEAVATYAAARMPATYHAIQSCYQQLPADFQPQSLLDLGAGPGTASLAALDFWQTLEHLTLVENHRLMVAFQKALWQHLSPDLSYQAVQDTIPSLGGLPHESYDLVVLAYVLGELKLQHQQEAVAQAWQKTRHYGLIVTPGTPHDFQYLLKARELLLSKGAIIIAPCTHQDRCPLTGTEDWCHFSVRLQRSSLHQSAKKATLSYEDEKFGYLLFGKAAVPLNGDKSRLVRKPIRRPGHVLLDVCANGKINRHIVGKADANFKKASKTEWGDVW